jgi:hypothetical protein
VTGEALPHAPTMGVVGLLALVVNPRRGLAALPLPRGRREPEVGVALLAQRRHRQPGGDGGRAAGVFGSGSAWPDLLVAALMALLGMSAARRVWRDTDAENRAHGQGQEQLHMH